MRASGGTRKRFSGGPKGPEDGRARPDDLYAVGTIAAVVQLIRMADGNVKALLEGRRRARLLEVIQDTPFTAARVEEMASVAVPAGVQSEALSRSLMSVFEQYLKANRACLRK